MRAIFENPLVFDEDDKKMVLIYSDYIISNITREEANLSIEKMKNQEFDSSLFESIIKIKDIFEYEFEPENDVCIMFGVKNSDGTSYENIQFKDAETTKLAEKSFREQFQKLGFKRTEELLTPLKAAFLPLSITGIVLLLGGVLTWLTYLYSDYQPSRTMIVKWYVYIFLKLSKFVGHIPFLIVTIVLVGLCLFWGIKRMANPPLKISAVK